MRILLVTDKFFPEIGGACAVAEALAANLPDNIAVVAPRTQISSSSLIEDWKTLDRRFQFSVYRVQSFEKTLPRSLPPRARGILQFAWNALWTRPRAAVSLYRIVRRDPADVVCVNTLPCYWVPAILRRLLPRIKVVFYLHGEEVNAGPRRTRIDQLAQQCWRQADAVVTVSSFTQTLALSCGIAPGKITVIHNGVDIVRFTPGPKDPDIVQRFHLAGKKVLLCLARLDERKGQDMLLQAMPAILASIPEAVLLLVGGGDQEQRLRTLAGTLNLQHAVLFAGVASDAERTLYYRTADVYVMPNRTTDAGDTEGFGLVFLEAGACGKPVIGGRAGGVPDAILDGHTGYLVDGRSTEQIAQACITLLADPTLAAACGEAGYRHSLQNSWSTQANKFLQLCEQLCSSITS